MPCIYPLSLNLNVRRLCLIKFKNLVLVGSCLCGAIGCAFVCSLLGSAVSSRVRLFVGAFGCLLSRLIWLFVSAFGCCPCKALREIKVEFLTVFK